METAMELVVTAEGGIRCLYGEVLDLSRLGRLAIARGSHVEPNDDGRWTADLSPVGGPLLGPYRLRTEALDAERQWLLANWL